MILATATITAHYTPLTFRISALKLHCCVLIRLLVWGSGMIYQLEIIWRGYTIAIYFPDGSSKSSETYNRHRTRSQRSYLTQSFHSKFQNLSNLASFTSYSQKEWSSDPNKKNANLILAPSRGCSLFQNNEGKLSQITKESSIVYMYYECSWKKKVGRMLFTVLSGSTELRYKKHKGILYNQIVGKL